MSYTKPTTAKFACFSSIYVNIAEANKTARVFFAVARAYTSGLHDVVPVFVRFVSFHVERRRHSRLLGSSFVIVSEFVEKLQPSHRYPSIVARRGLCGQYPTWIRRTHRWFKRVNHIFITVFIYVFASN